MRPELNVGNGGGPLSTQGFTSILTYNWCMNFASVCGVSPHLPAS